MCSAGKGPIQLYWLQVCGSTDARHLQPELSEHRQWLWMSVTASSKCFRTLQGEKYSSYLPLWRYLRTQKCKVINTRKRYKVTFLIEIESFFNFIVKNVSPKHFSLLLPHLIYLASQTHWNLKKLGDKPLQKLFLMPTSEAFYNFFPLPFSFSFCFFFKQRFNNLKMPTVVKNRL